MARRKAKMRDILVILPGLTGSVLEQKGRKIWAPLPHALVTYLRSLGKSLDALRIKGVDDPDRDDLGDGIRATRVWREYRRIRERTEVFPPHLNPWMDADTSDWRRFIGSMGTGRNQRSTLVRGIRENPETGECTAPFNRYGERLKASQHPILGIERDGVFLDTRTKFWELKTTGSDERTPGNTLAPLKSGSFPGDGEAFAPWTWDSVEPPNCRKAFSIALYFRSRSPESAVLSP